MFLPRHGMAANKTLRGLIAKNSACPIKDFFLGAANVGNQRVRWRDRPNPFNQVDDSAHRRGKDNEVASRYGFYRIFRPGIDGAHAAGAIYYRPAIATNNLPAEPGAFQGQGQRPANQSGADNGDLFERHTCSNAILARTLYQFTTTRSDSRTLPSPRHVSQSIPFWRGFQSFGLGEGLPVFPDHPITGDHQITRSKARPSPT